MKLSYNYGIKLILFWSNTYKGVYYYKSYNNSQLTAVDMRRESLDGDKLISYLLRTDGKVYCEN